MRPLWFCHANVENAKIVANYVAGRRPRGCIVKRPKYFARGLEGRAPYAVKVHGNALEYIVRPQRERFLPYALEGIRGASGVLVGSRHTAESLWEVLSDEPALPERTRLGPPGVDVNSFRPRPDEEAASGLTQLADKLDSGACCKAWRTSTRKSRVTKPQQSLHATRRFVICSRMTGPGLLLL